MQTGASSTGSWVSTGRREEYARGERGWVKCERGEDGDHNRTMRGQSGGRRLRSDVDYGSTSRQQHASTKSGKEEVCVVVLLVFPLQVLFTSTTSSSYASSTAYKSPLCTYRTSEAGRDACGLHTSRTIVINKPLETIRVVIGMPASQRKCLPPCRQQRTEFTPALVLSSAR